MEIREGRRLLRAKLVGSRCHVFEDALIEARAAECEIIKCVTSKDFLEEVQSN